MSNITLQYPNGYQEEQKYEILNGVKYMSPRPSTPHSDTAGSAFYMFKNYFKGSNCRVYFEPNLTLSDKDMVHPDVAVVCDADKIKMDGIHGAPDLIVEILSPSTSKRDRGYKFNLYEKHGVTEYWMVDTKNRTITVYMLNDDRYYLDNEYYIPDEYVLKRMTDEEKAQVQYEFKTHLADDLIIDIREVFENV
ncbi:MAG: Uma2 family endonuclease [Defluviitaleaceae bacterium]|nr:Uma2 family endonuclease [Defluviitaleaceae bacterium]